MKPVISRLRSLGYRTVVYLDDYLVFGKNYKNCKLNVDTTRNLLENLGLLLNVSPKMNVKYLGFVFNSREMTVELPEDKKMKAISSIKKITHYN